MSEDLLYVTFVILAVLLPIAPAWILYRFLPSRAIVTGPLKGFNVQLSGAFSGYFIVLIIVVGLIGARPQLPKSPYEVWSVRGAVVLENPLEGLNHYDVSVLPSFLVLSGDGGFAMDLPVRRDQGGVLDFPTLVIRRDGHEPAYVRLDDRRIGLIAGSTNRIVSDTAAKRKHIVEPITLKRVRSALRPHQPEIGIAPKTSLYDTLR